MLARPWEIRDADVFWHLATGKWILAQSSIPFTDPFSHTADTLLWADHEWFFQVVLRLVQMAGGLPLLFLLKGLLYTAGFTLPAWFAWRRGVCGSAAALAATLPMFAAFPFSEYRPVMVSVVLLAVVIELARQSAGGSRDAMWTLPVVFLVWANLHATFMIGWAAVFVFCAHGMIARQINIRQAAILLALSAAATLVNPYGWRLWLVPGSVAGSSLFMEANQEWRPPDLSIEFWGFYVCLAWAALAAALGRRRVPPADLILAAVLAVACVRSRRIIPYFCVAVIPLLSAALGAWAVSPAAALCRQAAAAAVVVAAGGAYALHFRAPADRLVYLPDGLAFINGAFPSHCAQTLSMTGPGCNLFNDYNHGGFLHYAVGPDFKVFIDGRNDLFGEELTRIYTSTMLAQDGWREVLDKHNVNAVIVSYEAAQTRPNLAVALDADRAKWLLADYDDAGMLFLRRDAFKQLPHGVTEYRHIRPMYLYDELGEKVTGAGNLAAFIAELRTRCGAGRCRLAEQTLALALIDTDRKDEARKVIAAQRDYYGADPMSDEILKLLDAQR